MTRILALCLLVAPSMFATEPFVVDHRKANIGGKQALMDIPKVPVLYEEDLKNCRVILAPEEAYERRISFPCGTWYLPPEAGRYVAWIENDVGISNAQGLINYVDDPYEGAGSVAAYSLVPAGYVRVQTPVPNGHTVRYLHVDSPGRGFQLRVGGPDAGKPVRVPQGRVVAGIFDPAGRAIAHSRPLTLAAGETTTFRVERPVKGADLVVVLRKSRPRTARTADLEAGGRSPDVHYENSSRLIALWYGLPTGPTTVTSDTLVFQYEVTLEERAVATVRGTTR